MPIRFSCEHCGQKLSVSSRKAGVVAKCPKCKQRIQVPEAASTAAPEDPAEAATGPSDAGPSGSEPGAAGDPFAQFVVYDEDVEWVYEDDEAPSSPPETDVDRDKVAIPRNILYAQGVLLGVVALIAFIFGILVGGGGASRDVALDVPQPCTVSGRVQYQTNGRGEIPDEGTVVIVLPQDQKPGPNQRVPIEGLRPGDPLPHDDHPGLRAIRMLGGGYTRADAQGQFQLRVPSSGQYFVLVVSNNAYRGEGEAPARADLAQLGGYFLPATELLGESRYQWTGVTIRRDRTWNIVF